MKLTIVLCFLLKRFVVIGQKLFNNGNVCYELYTKQRCICKRVEVCTDDGRHRRWGLVAFSRRGCRWTGFVTRK